MPDHQKQQEFEQVVKLYNSWFPKQINSRSLLDRWDECQMYIHVASKLAKSFQEYSKDRPPIQTLPELGELLKNSVW